MTQDSISLTLQPREVTGKAVRHLRRDGHLPAVIHDHGKPSLVVQGDYIEMMKVWRQAGKHHPVQLKAGDKTLTALIKTADFDPKKHDLRHIVFNAVRADEKVEAEIPVHPRYGEGNDAAPAERSGLLVLAQLDTVLVEAVPSQLPDVLYYDAEKLVEIGDHATVDDLVMPPGVIAKTDASHAIATVYEPSALQAANEAAGGTAEEEAAPAAEGEGEEEAEAGAEGEEAETETTDSEQGTENQADTKTDAKEAETKKE